MKSDIIHVSSSGVGVDNALAQAELVASYKSLPRKNALHLRLLTEEMMGMLQAITGNLEADFWIEDENDGFRLHLKTNTFMNTRLREELLSASTSGENAAAKGVMGKIRDLFERSLEPLDDSMPDFYASGWMYASADPANVSMVTPELWSLNRYRSSLEDAADSKQDWDELEKSIVANIADEVEISIQSNVVEMIIYKKF